MAAMAALTGCQCNRSNIPQVEGEVRWQFETAEGMFSDSVGELSFPLTDMGTRREKVIFVQNAGRAAFTLAEFAKVSGADVTLGTKVVANAPFEVKFDPAKVVNPTELAPITVIFAPPVTPTPDLFIDHSVEVELRPQGAPAAPLTLKGRALAPECFIPEVVDFGSIPIRTFQDIPVSLRNVGMAPVKVTTGKITGAPALVFLLSGVDAMGELVVNPNEAPEALLTFKPREPGEFTAQVMMRRSQACPERMVSLRGRAVPVCLSWEARPSVDDGNSLEFGNIFPGAGPGKGTITFQNHCTFGVQVAQLRTTDPVFALTATSLDVTSLIVPPAMRSAATWQAGTGKLEMEFRPPSLGRRTGQLQGITSAAWQPDLTIKLGGTGGGPRIDVQPPVIAFGRMGFTQGAIPALVVQKRLKVSNVGTQVTPVDISVNLHLGKVGDTAVIASVRAISGTADELCFGEWDAATQTCSNSLGGTAYNPLTGIEAVGSAAVSLPLYLVPKTEGLKEWELTLFSDDSVTPTVTVKVTAEAVNVPPCTYTVAPASLEFGNLELPNVRDLSFTITNRGTAADQICLVNGLALSVATADTFTVPGAVADFSVGPGETRPIVVHAQPLRIEPMPVSASGEVLFNISAPEAQLNRVTLSAVLAPNCVTMTPSPLTFASTELECAAPDRLITITNGCTTAVTLKSATLTAAAPVAAGTGSCAQAAGCPQFSMVAPPSMGTMAPGATRTVPIRYAPYQLGAAAGELTITVQQGTQVAAYSSAIAGDGITRNHPGCGVSAVCPASMTVAANSTVTLAPTIMVTGVPTCAWGIASRPMTSSGSFSAPTSCASTTYFADVAGSHLVRFTASDVTGGSAECTTEITVRPNGNLWVELTWDKPNDVDLHLLHPSAGDGSLPGSWGKFPWDCSFTNDKPNWMGPPAENPSLDRDDVALTGPENTRIDSPSRSLIYTVGAHMFNYRAGSPVTSTVKVYCAGQLVATRSKAMNRLNALWVVGTIDFSAATPCKFTPNDQIITPTQLLVHPSK